MAMNRRQQPDSSPPIAFPFSVAVEQAVNYYAFEDVDGDGSSPPTSGRRRNWSER